MTTLTNLLIICLGFVQYKATRINSNPVAFIDDSSIVGQRIQHLDLEANQFLGVPYAEPPNGNLRFMRTQPIKSYPKVFRAFKQPPACHQYATKPYPWYINSTEKKSEDCLYLNIWTPTDASPENTKAVLYWIHGGGFQYGSIRDPLYNGTALASIGDIVVVTVNYRVGPLGFMTSNTRDAPGNAGLWDILEGLKWVNRNILAFGGDTTRITIAGESAGSISVGLLSVSPLSRGLFTRQITQSLAPTNFAFDNHTNNIDLSQFVSTKVKCASESYTIYEHPTEVTDCLKDVDPVVLSKVDELIHKEPEISFLPQYGDAILPENPRIAIINGKFQDTELLGGVNKDEGVILANNYDKFFGFFGEKNPHVNKTNGKEILRKVFGAFPHPESIVDFYLNDSIAETAYEDIRREMFASFGDSSLLCPTLFYAEKDAGIGKDVYVYQFVHEPSTGPWAPGIVGHFSEVQFVFGRPILYPHLYQLQEVQLGKQMMTMWSNFVKNGNPGFSWPLYRRDCPLYMYLGPGADTQNYGIGPHVRGCNFWRAYYGF